MSGHTSVLSLGSIIDAPIRRHYNSIRPCPEAATTLAPLRRPTLWFIWRGHRTRARSDAGGFERSIRPRFGWPDGFTCLHSRSVAAREQIRRLGLVTLDRMVAALARVLDNLARE